TGWAVGSAGTILKTTNSGSTFIRDEDKLIKPQAFLLNQNFPNPFNPSTKINYSVPHTTFITLKIFDILGREVAALINEEKPAGSYEIEFDGANLSSGVYFYQLQAGDFVETKKMVLLR
ncbi:MAG TPA: T9SS type A sorting domain-containing protein, partial [Ignavibacteriaceae bacterium]|nr:T9SS type A sorting domain-containing protein [Ignavibacteriaceae bacterium]